MCEKLSNAQQSCVPATALTFDFLRSDVGNLTKNRLKIDATSSKIHQKSFKNQSKIIKTRSWAFWEVPERSWRCLESVLGAVLGGRWAVLGTSWAILGDLGRFLGRLGGQVGSKLEPKNFKKSIPKSIKIVMRFGIDLASVSGAF